MISYLREGLAVVQAGGRDRQICLLDGGPTLIGLGCRQLSGKAGSIGKTCIAGPRHAPCFSMLPMGHKTADYEKILRAIGQGLEALSVEEFDLELANDLFMIQVTAVRSRATKLNAPKLGGIRKALKICSSSKKRSSPQIPAGKLSGAPVLLSLQFTRTDIDNLEREGQVLRSDWKGSPLAHSLPQVLRTVGWYVDQKQGRLHKITQGSGSVIVSYTGSLGTEKNETLTLLQIYDMWVHLFKQRKGYFQLG